MHMICNTIQYLIKQNTEKKKQHEIMLSNHKELRAKSTSTRHTEEILNVQIKRNNKASKLTQPQRGRTITLPYNCN